MSDGAENDRIGGCAFLKRTSRPFDVVFSVIVTAAFDLFDAKINLKKFTRGAQNAQTF